MGTRRQGILERCSPAFTTCRRAASCRSSSSKFCSRGAWKSCDFSRSIHLSGEPLARLRDSEGVWSTDRLETGAAEAETGRHFCDPSSAKIGKLQIASLRSACYQLTLCLLHLRIAKRTSMPLNPTAVLPDEVKVMLLLACRVSRVREIFSAVSITSFSKPSAGTPSHAPLSQQHL